MALLGLRREAAVQEVDTKAELDYDVLELRRLQDHPRVALLLQRRAALLRRLTALEEQRGALQHALSDIERGEGQRIAEMGDQWEAPVEWRQKQETLKDLEAQTRMVHSGFGPLDEELDRAGQAAREEIEARLNGLRLPHVRQVVKGLEAIAEDNQTLHQIERVSQRLLGFARWHLFDGGLAQRRNLIERTRLLLDGGDEA